MNKTKQDLTTEEALKYRVKLMEIMKDRNSSSEVQQQAEDYYYGIREGHTYDTERLNKFIWRRR